MIRRPAGSTAVAGPDHGRAADRAPRRSDRVALAVVTLGMSLIVAAGGAPGVFVRVAVVVAIGLLADLAVRTASPGWRAATLASVGAVALVVGGVLAMSEVTDVDSVARLLGSVLAVAGAVAALVSAVRWTVGRVRGWRLAAAVAVAALLSYAVLLPLGIAIYATNPPRGSLDARTPAGLGLAYSDAVVTTTDGITLTGWYIPSTNGAAVVMLPGSGSTRSATLQHAGVLAGHGYGVLLLDPRGHGESAGPAMDLGWYGDQDVAAGVEYLSRRPDVDPERIAVVGLSMGGEEAIGAMAVDPRIRAVVAEGATRRVWRDRAWLVDSYGIRGRIQLGVDAITDGLADLLTDADPPPPLGDAIAAAAPRPVLLIAADQEADEVTAAAALQLRSPATVSVWSVPGADHIGGLAADPAGWDRRVAEFLNAAVAPAP